MSKTLYLLRHAKSSWADTAVDDHDRPLQPKGERRAERQRDHMAESDIDVDLVLCSTALRARQTYDIVAPALGEPEVQYRKDIYGAETQDVVKILNQIDEDQEHVLLVGHDPTLHLLVMELAMTASGDAKERVHRKFPTSGLATLTFGGASWGSLGKGVGHLEAFYVPQDDPVA